MGSNLKINSREMLLQHKEEIIALEKLILIILTGKVNERRN